MDVIEQQTIQAADIVAAFAAVFPWKANGVHLAVLPFAEAERVGSIIVPEQARQKPQYGIVVDAGPGAIATETGRAIPVTHKAGEIVMFGQYSGIKPDPVEGWDFYLLNDEMALMRHRDQNMALVFHEAKKAVHFAGYYCEHCPQHETASAEDRRERRLTLAGMSPELLGGVEPEPQPDGPCAECRHPISRHAFSGCLEKLAGDTYCPCKETHGSADPTNPYDRAPSGV